MNKQDFISEQVSAKVKEGKEEVLREVLNFEQESQKAHMEHGFGYNAKMIAFLYKYAKEHGLTITRDNE